ncbi:hypothetical protein [Solimonas sp. SE-A11]|uniref:hypothetical protein n=1 Tax=Solimonas sp. SE-A11 TaxID=3054954 RepID=UPI00259CEF93|nr:hypothetical protein [Solimonas sp. SE-A11]MDM4772872.1 hypothetical protein [Solimonas sp. SE-A11]
MMLTDIDQKKRDSTDTISVINMLKLLEMYEYDLFEQAPPPGLVAWEDSTNLNHTSGSAYLDLRAAMAAVHHELDDSLSIEDFSRVYGNSLAVFSPDAGVSPQPDDRHNATAFLKMLDAKLNSL